MLLVSYGSLFLFSATRRVINLFTLVGIDWSPHTRKSHTNEQQTDRDTRHTKKLLKSRTESSYALIELIELIHEFPVSLPTTKRLYCEQFNFN